MNSVVQQDYYPFGMVQPNRNWAGNNYRFGFNGKENDNEIKGIGNSLDFGARIYDSRLGRWLSLDPLQAKFPSISPYVFSNNSPLLFNDLDGKEPIITNYKATTSTINGKTVINISAEVTIKGKIINNSSNSYVDMQAVASFINQYGSDMLEGSGTVNRSEAFKFDGKGGVDKPKDVRINYNINVKFDVTVAKTIDDIDRNDDVVIFQNDVSVICDAKTDDVLGCHDGSLVSQGKVDKTQWDTYRLAHLGLHELLHGYGLSDKYKRGPDEKITDAAWGNVMGVIQKISEVSANQSQKDEFAMDIFRTYEAKNLHKTDYAGLQSRGDAKTIAS